MELRLTDLAGEPVRNLSVELNGALAADIDIDESADIEYGFEVIRNAAFRSRTNPFLVLEFLLSADPIGKSLDPGYQFRFSTVERRRAITGRFVCTLVNGRYYSRGTGSNIRGAADK